MDLLIFEHFAHLATDDDDLHVICVCSHLLQLLCCSVPSCRLVSVPKKAKNSFSVTTTTATALFLSIIIMIPIFHDNIIFSLSFYYSSSRITAWDFGIFWRIHIRQSHWCPMHFKTILSSSTTGFLHQWRTGKFGHNCMPNIIWVIDPT